MDQKPLFTGTRMTRELQECVTILRCTIVGVATLFMLLRPAVAESKPIRCPPDAVAVGTVCIDKYEASVWSIPATATSLIKKVQDGKADRDDLTAPCKNGVECPRQISPTSDAGSGECDPPLFPTTFSARGSWTTPLYAASVAGVKPTGCLTWFQAEQACRLSGKRLATNQEWQAAAGTPDPGPDDGVADCNLMGRGTVETGSRAKCMSGWGAFDMVGNATEWVADWTQAGTLCSTAGSAFGIDVNCLQGAAAPSHPHALARGFDGVFAIETFAVDTAPTYRNLGFRCAR
jgi:hypothetical protein